MDSTTHTIDPEGEVIIIVRNANGPFAQLTGDACAHRWFDFSQLSLGNPLSSQWICNGTSNPVELLGRSGDLARSPARSPLSHHSYLVLDCHFPVFLPAWQRRLSVLRCIELILVGKDIYLFCGASHSLHLLPLPNLLWVMLYANIGVPRILTTLGRVGPGL